MVTITNNTKISDIIRLNPDSIDAIASVAKPLEKLKNPLLRKLMASRVTLAQAAAIGGCDLAQLHQVLVPLGFTFKEDFTGHTEEMIEKKPLWLISVPQDRIFNFDARPVLAAGGDPLKAIVKKFGALHDGDILCILNSFVPYPLIHLLAKEAQSFTMEISPAEHHTWFLKRKQELNPQSHNPSDSGLMMNDEKAFEDALAKFEESCVRRIDVRELSMPAPMEKILEELAGLPDHHVLYVYHKKVPVYLLETLRDQHFTVHLIQLSAGDVRLLIYTNR